MAQYVFSSPATETPRVISTDERRVDHVARQALGYPDGSRWVRAEERAAFDDGTVLYSVFIGQTWMGNLVRVAPVRTAL